MNKLQNDIFDWLEEIPEGSRLIVYGAGMVGRELVKQLHADGRYRIVAWVDQQYKSLRKTCEWVILPPHDIKKIAFDYVVIAVSKSAYIKEIKVLLQSLNIPSWKIIAENREAPVYLSPPMQMKSVVLLDTEVSSSNLGDGIIMGAVRNEMDYILKKYFVLNFSTHVPIASQKQLDNNFRYEFLKRAHYTFCCGTDLLQDCMDVRIPQWNIDNDNCKVLRNVVLLGVGSSARNQSNHFDEYTSDLLRKVLSRDIIHSVRDEDARRMLAEIGIEAINTGCPTLWKLTSDFCELIPSAKSDAVVFSVSEYKKDVKNDQELVNILRENYEKLFFWSQTIMDYNYLRKIIPNVSDIQLIQPNLQAYSEFLLKNAVDYVGTRLHGGIYAMQHAKRSLILGIDTRAENMYKECNINYVKYGDWEGLRKKINTDFVTNILLPEKEIQYFKNQFK